MYTQKIKFLTAIGVIALIVGISLIAIYRPSKKSVLSSVIIFDTKEIAVELATNPTAWEKGLSGRKELAADTGLLFVFSHPDLWSIWMKDMYFSIDIVWLDVTRKVIKIEENVAPETYPTIYEPETPARYVLEVPAGTVQKYGIKVGDRAYIQQQK